MGRKRRVHEGRRGQGGYGTGSMEGEGEFHGEQEGSGTDVKTEEVHGEALQSRHRGCSVAEILTDAHPQRFRLLSTSCSTAVPHVHPAIHLCFLVGHRVLYILVSVTRLEGTLEV